MSFWERDDGRRWCACFQVWQPPSDTRTCEAGGCPELRSVTECRHCGHTVNESCGARNNMDGDVLHGHRLGVVATAAREAWRDARTVTSTDQLDALPEGSILRRSFTSCAGLELHEIWEHLFAGWYCIGAPTSPPMGDYGIPSLPALLIWHPDWGQHSRCRNCDGRKCMGCVFREYDHDCKHDCPDCCAAEEGK